jgi:UDP-hydrolysing UDP-N-acetyl-D-glucosamine 2-epimerase
MPSRKICIVTGSRADYGLLYWLMKEIQNDSYLELQIIATGMHLSPEFGLTYKEIEKDGFTINEKIEMLLSSDSPVGITKSIGLATIGFADALERQEPDIVVVLGDRYEILAAVQAALVARIPIAHIAGGDITEGAFDDAIRHSITKMSHLHFVTNELAAARVLQMGERPDCIYNVGSPGIDYISHLTLLEREELEEALEFTFKEKNLLITFHPPTLDDEPAALQFRELLAALSFLGPDVGIIFTKPNSDPGGRVIIQMIDDYVTFHSNTKAYASLGQLYYLSTIAQVDAVMGNSSSGLYEAPSFRKPTVNIGNRQKGRLQASSVINCDPDTASITRAIEEAFTKDYSNAINPYGDGNSSIKIKEIIKEREDIGSLIKKRFIDFKK